MIPVPCAPTFPSFRPIFRLDRVWHDAPFLKVDAKVLAGREISALSDHLPIMLEISA
jgi:endonuclease/exonuclease/phosphatase family metal-dependent hydrolase